MRRWLSTFWTFNEIKEMKTLYILVIVSSTLRGFAAEVVTPLANGFGGQTIFPFFATTNAAPSVRYQQVYSPKDFVSQVSAPQYLITGMVFTAGSAFGPDTVNIPSLQLRLSTSQHGPDALSTTFGQNVGLDEATVYSGSLQVQASSSEWGMRINLQQPFLYDPTKGNLLLDVQNFQTLPTFPGQPSGQWYAATMTNMGDPSSSIWALNVNAANATRVTSESLYTKFLITPIPEPTSAILLLVGCGLVFLVFSRSRSTRRSV